ncbi:MAG: MATE family efflux transporter [Clostridia bacterium]|nr:MATE family efflux transporter [Clostridia bacterium]
MSGKLLKIKNTLVGDRAFYNRIIAILIPIVIQNTFTNAVSLVDNVMVGRIGELEMSAVAIVNQLLFVFNLCIFGGLSGIGIFTAQFAGAKDITGVRRTIRAKNYISLAMLIIGLIIFIAVPVPLLKLYIAEDTSPADAELMLTHALDYLYIMLIGLAPFAISQVYGSTLREEGETKLPMIGGVAAIIVNLVLNYILIFGYEGLSFLPFAPMGVAGAAIATVISRFIEMLLLIVITHSRKKKYPFFVGVYRTAKIPLSLCKDMLIKGSPLLFNEFLWSFGMAVLLQCYSVRGLECVAAANISSTVLNLFNVVCFSMGSAIAIILGQHLGADEVEEAKNAVWKLFALSVASCLVMGTALALCSGIIPQFYEASETTRELASSMLFIVACTMPIFAFAHAVYFTLRSGGKTLLTFIFDCGFTWGVTIPFAFIAAHFTGMPILTIYLCVQLLDLTKCIVGYVLIKKGIWINRLISE